jgi:hypothetical protein
MFEKSWTVISRNQTSIGAQEWILRRMTTTAHVFALPGGGIRARFTGASETGEQTRILDLRAEAHAGRCYALVCDKIVDFFESGHDLDAKPVRVSGGSLEIMGADALVALGFYFEGHPGAYLPVSGVSRGS